MPAPDHELVSSDGVIHVRRYGPVFAGTYDMPLTVTALTEVLEWQHGVMPDEPIISYSVAFGAQRLPSDVQAAANRLIAEFGDRTCASASVLVADGFQASAARAMLSTIYLLTRVSYPRKVFANVSDAESWLHDLRGGSDEAVYAAARWLAEREKMGPTSRAAHN